MSSTIQTPQIAPLTREVFDRFCTLIYDHTHIRMRESKQLLVSNRLRRRIIALNLSSYDEYYRYLTEGACGSAELQRFIDAVSTNETYFYREVAHFSALLQSVLPELLARRKTLRIWCAGCSTGEEPYTLRIAIVEGLQADVARGITIVATDINEQVIESARAGVYRGRSVRLVPPAILDRYFEHLGEDSFRVRRVIADTVDFRVHNLMTDEPPGRMFDVIFCRNVMIYFDKPTQRRLVDGYFASALENDGYLFIGHSESLTGTSGTFQYVRGLGAPVYRKGSVSR